MLVKQTITARHNVVHAFLIILLYERVTKTTGINVL